MVSLIATAKKERRQVEALTRQVVSERNSILKSRINSSERETLALVLDCAAFAADKSIIGNLLSRGVLERKPNGLFLTMYGMEAYYGAMDA